MDHTVCRTSPPHCTVLYCHRSVEEYDRRRDHRFPGGDQRRGSLDGGEVGGGAGGGVAGVGGAGQREGG